MNAISLTRAGLLGLAALISCSDHTSFDSAPEVKKLPKPYVTATITGIESAHLTGNLIGTSEDGSTVRYTHPMCAITLDVDKTDRTGLVYFSTEEEITVVNRREERHSKNDITLHEWQTRLRELREDIEVGSRIGFHGTPTVNDRFGTLSYRLSPRELDVIIK